jgi:thymidylate synthase (FAD)
MGIELLRFIELQARISHRTEGAQTPDSWKRFIEFVVLSHGDWSVTEHAGLTVTFRVDRGVTHELVRHRLFSFTQESTRFVNYKKKAEELEFIAPAGFEEPYPWEWIQALAEAERDYLQLLENGKRPQEARSVLPNALAATIAMTGNLRSWRWFLLARTTKETHPDMRRVTDRLLEELKRKVPLLYDDIVVGERQIDNARKAH